MIQKGFYRSAFFVFTAALRSVSRRSAAIRTSSRIHRRAATVFVACGYGMIVVVPVMMLVLMVVVIFVVRMLIMIRLVVRMIVGFLVLGSVHENFALARGMGIELGCGI